MAARAWPCRCVEAPPDSTSAEGKNGKRRVQIKPSPIRSCEGEVHTDVEQIGRREARRDGDATSWMHGGFIISSGLLP